MDRGLGIAIAICLGVMISLQIGHMLNMQCLVEASLPVIEAVKPFIPAR